VIAGITDLDLPLFVNAAALKMFSDEGGVAFTGWSFSFDFGDSLVDRIDWMDPPGDF
jgi:hypothetical protein